MIYSKLNEITDSFALYQKNEEEHKMVSICGYFLLRDSCPVFEVHSINSVDDMKTLLLKNNRLHEIPKEQ